MLMKYLRNSLGLLIVMFLPMKAFAWADWHEGSIEVVHGSGYQQFGGSASSVDGTPIGGSREDSESTLTTLTLEYANGWKYGDTYFYVDVYFDHDTPLGQEEVAFYTQGWESFSLNKMFDTKAFQVGDGTFIEDVSLSVGWQLFNLDDFQSGTAGCGQFFGKCVFEAHDLKDLFYGVKVHLGDFGWDGIQYMGLSVGIYDDLNRETDYDNQLSVNWFARANWYWGESRWQYDGFIQWYDDRDSNTGTPDMQSYIYSQHQIKWDAGLTLFNRPNALFVGTEIQWTDNTFGVTDVPFSSKESNELFPAFLVEWVF